MDERPVFEEDRRFAEAFARGGRDEEKTERQRWDDERREKQLQYLRDFDEMVKKAKVQRKDDEKSAVDDIELTDEKRKQIHDLAFSESTTTAQVLGTHEGRIGRIQQK